MNRFSNLTLALTAFAASAIAGQIQVGGADGLTAAYIASGCSTNVAGQSCVTGSTTNFYEQNYDQRLFQQATPSLGAISNSASSYPHSMTTPVAGTLTGVGSSDLGTVFSMINDGCNTGGVGSGPGAGGTAATCGTTGAVTNNFWQAQNTAGTGASVTIPVGIFDVTDVTTVLNNLWGLQGASETTLTFNFSSISANDTTNVTKVVVNLTNSGNTATPSGQIQGSIDCNIPASTPCSNYDIGPTAASTPSSSLSGTNINGLTVDTNTLFRTGYTSTPSSKYTGTTGTVSLTDQVFDFTGTPFSSGYYLESITVADSSGKASTSQTALSAITVDTSVVPTPEPSTVLLVMAGIGAIGFSRLRRS
jgi:hypothetical protein